MKTDDGVNPGTTRHAACRIVVVMVLVALFYAFHWMPLRVAQRDLIAWSLEVTGYESVSFVYLESPAIRVQNKLHFYTAACTYLDLMLIVAPFLWVFGATRRNNILRIAVAALVILGCNLVRCWAAVYLDVLGVNRFYAHDLPDYIIWWPTVAGVVLLALRRDFAGRSGSPQQAHTTKPASEGTVSDACARRRSDNQRGRSRRYRRELEGCVDHNGASHNNGWHLQYSCCNEDAQSELSALNLRGRKTVAVAAAGGRAFSLLLGDPQEVTAVDINPVQIHLCLLKYHAIRLLDRTEYLRFIGIARNGDRASTYRALSEHLPDDTCAYWDARLDLIGSGLIGAGRYERSIAVLSAIFRFTRGGTIARLRACADMAEQDRLVSSRLWNPGWRLLFGLLFNPMMGRFVIRDESFYGRPRRRAGAYLVNRLNTLLENNLARDSFILEMYTTGVLSEDGPLPLHLLDDNYEIVRKRLDRLSFVCGDIAQHLECREPGSVGAFSLSDLGSYLGAEGLSRVLAQVERTACVGATFCLREFLCQPRLHAEWPKRIRRNRDLEERLGRSDLSMGYTLVCAEVVS